LRSLRINVSQLVVPQSRVSNTPQGINAEAIALSIKFRLSSLTIKTPDSVESIMQGLLSSKDLSQLSKIGDMPLDDYRL